MISMSLKQVLALFGESRCESLELEFQGVTIDSRKDCSGRLFVAIRGDNFDGHDYVSTACENGAVAALVETEVDSDIPQIVVKDCKQAMASLANFWRHSCKATVIALTGSNGKTTVKDMLFQILLKEAPTQATRGNFNNDIGLPLTLYEVSPEDRYVITEMGANHKGEIAHLAEIAEPDIVYVNNVAASHLAGFGSVQGVIEAKGELYAYCKPRHRALFNLDEAATLYWRSICAAENTLTCAVSQDAEVGATWHQDDSGLTLDLTYGGEKQSVHLQVFGEHNARNATAAISIAVLANIEFSKAAQNLAEFAGVKGRLQMVVGPNHSRLIDDSYNANPGSLEAGIKVLCSLPGDAWVALGDMGELGDEAENLHRRAAQMARGYGVKKIFGVGQMSHLACREFGEGGNCFDRLDEMAGSIQEQINQDVNLLIKGSRSAGMERLVDMLKTATNQGEMNHVL